MLISQLNSTESWYVSSPLQIHIILMSTLIITLSIRLPVVVVVHVTIDVMMLPVNIILSVN